MPSLPILCTTRKLDLEEETGDIIMSLNLEGVNGRTANIILGNELLKTRNFCSNCSIGVYLFSLSMHKFQLPKGLFTPVINYAWTNARSFQSMQFSLRTSWPNNKCECVCFVQYHPLFSKKFSLNKSRVWLDPKSFKWILQIVTSLIVVKQC